MKECPICHTRYGDNVNFCNNDGSRLVDVVEKPEPQPAPQPTPAPAPTPQPQPVYQQPQPAPANPGTPPAKSKGTAKKLLTALVVVAAAAAFGYHYYNNAATYLRLDPEEVELGKSGKIDVHVGIDYDGYTWKVSYNPSWVAAWNVPGDKNKIDIFADPNDTGSPREGDVNIKSGKQHAILKVRQRAFATYIKPETTEVKFPKEGGTKTIKINTDGTGYTITDCPGAETEIDSDGNLKITVGELDSGTAAWGGGITLSEDNVSCYISVSQAEWN